MVFMAGGNGSSLPLGRAGVGRDGDRGGAGRDVQGASALPG
jgi:hypothetical protein